jgi:hypothetical protein
MGFRYWRLDDHRGVDLLKADASAHRYARHSHEGYAIGVVSTGAHAFTARGEVWTAVPGRIVIVNPDDAHDGGPAGSDDRYSYRMIYVDESVMSATLAEAVGGRAAVPLFPSAVVEDAALATRILTLHRSLEYPHARLERETTLITALAELARRHGGAARRGGTSPTNAPSPTSLRSPGSIASISCAPSDAPSACRRTSTRRNSDCAMPGG